MSMAHYECECCGQDERECDCGWEQEEPCRVCQQCSLHCTCADSVKDLEPDDLNP